MRIRAQAPALISAAAFALTSCSPAVTQGPSPSPIVSKAVLATGDWEPIGSFDPLPAGTFTRLRADTLVFARLWSYDPSLKPVPELASRVPSRTRGDVKLAGAGMDVTVHLRAGLSWSDGSPLTAADAAFTWTATCSAGTGAALAYLCPLVTAEAPSDRVLTFHFRTVYAPYLAALSRFFVLPRSRLGATPSTAWPSLRYFAAPDVTSGPFRVVSATSGAVYFDRNPHYFGRTPYLARIVWRQFVSHDAAVVAASTGAVALLPHLGPADVLTAGVGDLDLRTGPSLREEMLVPSAAAGTPWAADRTVLQALALAVDRESLNAQAFNGAAVATASLFPPLLGFHGTADTRARLADAERLLDAAGWKTGTGGVRTRHGARLRFRLTSPCDDPVRDDEATAIVAEWRAAGAQVSYTCGLAGAEMKLQSDVFDPDPGSVTRPDWPACWDPAAQADLASAGRTFDEPNRRRLYERAAVAWVQALCTIPLEMWPEVDLVSADLHGFRANPTAATDFWNAAQWWLA